MAEEALTFSTLTAADQKAVKRVLDGDVPFEPPYADMTVDGIAYLAMVLHQMSEGHAREFAAIELGEHHGCDTPMHLTLVQ